MLSTTNVKTVQIGLNSVQWAKLQQLAKDSNITVSEAVRRLLDKA